MKRLNLILILTILLSGCSSFFNKNPAFEGVSHVAVASVYIDRDLERIDWQQNNDQNNAIKLDRQRLMNASHAFLQQNMATHLGWQVLPDIRHSVLSQVQGSGDRHYESLQGMALLSAEAVQLLSEGKKVNHTTLAILKEACKQLNVDALAVLLIDSNAHHGTLPSVFSKKNLPEINLRIAVVNQTGALILNTDEFPVAYSVESLSEKVLSRESEVLAHEKILTQFQIGIQEALDQYFYQSAQEFKRMGYVLNASLVSKSTQAGAANQAAGPGKTPSAMTKENKPTITKTHAPPRPASTVSREPDAKSAMNSEIKAGTATVTTPVTEPFEKKQVDMPAPVPKAQNDNATPMTKRDLWSLPVGSP